MEWFACDREVWGADRGVKGESAKEIVDKDRGEDCFFWPVQADRRGATGRRAGPCGSRPRAR